VGVVGLAGTETARMLELRLAPHGPRISAVSIDLVADYALVGDAEVFPILVTDDEQNAIGLGDRVTVTGDGVPDRRAHVTEIGNGWVMITIELRSACATAARTSA
jgi:hypothetical protein